MGWSRDGSGAGVDPTILSRAGPGCWIPLLILGVILVLTFLSQ